MTDTQRTRVLIALICTLFFAMDQLFPKQASLTAWVFLVTSWAATAWSLWSDEQ
jgi:hypothetical protein